jgi:hypothetical protein
VEEAKRNERKSKSKIVAPQHCQDGVLVVTRLESACGRKMSIDEKAKKCTKQAVRGKVAVK